MAIHAVLVEGNEQVDAITHIGDLFRARTNREKCVAAANDRLIGVVGVEVQASTAEDFGEDISRRGHALSCRTTQGR